MSDVSTMLQSFPALIGTIDTINNNINSAFLQNVLLNTTKIATNWKSALKYLFHYGKVIANL